MLSKIKKIILFLILAIILFAIYFLFLKPKTQEPNLQTQTAENNSTTENQNEKENNKESILAKEFLNLLLNVKSIEVNQDFFANPIFRNLKDSEVLLSQDKSEGRPNPFAPIGQDNSTIQNTTDVINQLQNKNILDKNTKPSDLVPLKNGEKVLEEVEEDTGVDDAFLESDEGY